MSAFWIATALMTAATVAVVVFPLLRASGQQKAKRAEYDITVYKDQLAEIDRDFERGLLAEAEADAARIEIQRRMLKAAAPSVEDTAAGKAKPAPTRSIALTGLLAVGVTAGAFGLYAYKGSPEMSDRPYASRDIAAEITAREGRLERREVMQLIARLLETMKKRPDDIRGWILLARTYMTISEFEGAMGAFKRAVDLSNRDPEVVADYAEAMILAQDGNIPETAKTLYAEILTKDPYNPKAGYYLGLAKAQAGDLKGALQTWVDLRAISPPDAAWMEILNRQISGIAGELKIDIATIKPSARAQALRQSSNIPTKPPTPASSAPTTPSTQRGPSAADVKAAGEMSAVDRQQMIRTMVQRLADRLKDNPDDLAGWQRLAKAYEVLGDAEKAREARARIKALQK